MKSKSTAHRAADIIFAGKAEDFKNISADALALKLGVSAQQLSASFQKEFDFYINDFIDHNITYQAALLLKSRKKLSIKEISELFNFTEVDGFITIFKKHFGISPDRYRETARQQRNK